jgi:hypothetical protein
MSAVNTAALLTAWEEAFSQPPVQRALTLLSAGCPETPAGDWARMCIGARDRALLDLQDRMFGSGLEATTECPACGERVEVTFTTGEVRAPKPSKDRFQVSRAGYEVECRLPNSLDLLALADESEQSARVVLLQRCIERATRRSQHIDFGELPPEVLQAVAEQMADADPQAEIRVAMECPGCRNKWSMDFDITSYLWTELQDWAHREVREVHALASAYGWSEREVLSMSARRRRLYLEMVEG